MNNVQKLHVAVVFGDWLTAVKTKLDPQLFLVGTMIVDSLGFLEYSLLLKMTDLFLSSPIKDNLEWIDTHPILALSVVCHNLSYNVGGDVIDGYITLIHRREITKDLLENLLIIVREQTYEN